MALMRDRPYGNARFLVDLGTGDPRSAAGGFCEVVLPTLRLVDGDEPSAEPELLVLRRGFSGTLDLHAWFGKAQRGKAPKRARRSSPRGASVTCGRSACRTRRSTRCVPRY